MAAPTTTELTRTTRTILEMIASGHNYDQILAACPDFTYLDIFRAAEEALDASAASPRPSTLAERRERYPRAYEKWTDAEDADLREQLRSGATVARIAGHFQRNRGAIRSRIVKLGLLEELAPREQARLLRLIEA